MEKGYGAKPSVAFGTGTGVAKLRLNDPKEDTQDSIGHLGVVV